MMAGISSIIAAGASSCGTGSAPRSSSSSSGGGAFTFGFSAGLGGGGAAAVVAGLGLDFPLAFPPWGAGGANGSGVSSRPASPRTVSGGGATKTLPQNGQRTFLPRGGSRRRIFSLQSGQEVENVGVSAMGQPLCRIERDRRASKSCRRRLGNGLGLLLRLLLRPAEEGQQPRQDHCSREGGGFEVQRQRPRAGR